MALPTREELDARLAGAAPPQPPTNLTPSSSPLVGGAPPPRRLPSAQELDQRLAAAPSTVVRPAAMPTIGGLAAQQQMERQQRLQRQTAPVLFGGGGLPTYPAGRDVPASEALYAGLSGQPLPGPAAGPARAAHRVGQFGHEIPALATGALGAAGGGMVAGPGGAMLGSTLGPTLLAGAEHGPDAARESFIQSLLMSPLAIGAPELGAALGGPRLGAAAGAAGALAPAAIEGRMPTPEEGLFAALPLAHTGSGSLLSRVRELPDVPAGGPRPEPRIVPQTLVPEPVRAAREAEVAGALQRRRAADIIDTFRHLDPQEAEHFKNRLRDERTLEGKAAILEEAHAMNSSAGQIAENQRYDLERFGTEEPGVLRGRPQIPGGPDVGPQREIPYTRPQPETPPPPSPEAVAAGAETLRQMGIEPAPHEQPLPGGRGEPTAAPPPEPSGRASEVPLNVRPPAHTLETALGEIGQEGGGPTEIPTSAADLDAAMAEMRGESTPATRQRAAEMSARLREEKGVVGPIGTQEGAAGVPPRALLNEPSGSTRVAGETVPPETVPYGTGGGGGEKITGIGGGGERPSESAYGKTVYPVPGIGRGTRIKAIGPSGGAGGGGGEPPVRKVFEGEPVGGGRGTPGEPSPAVNEFFARTGEPPPKAKTLLPRIGEQLRKTFVTAYRLRGAHKVYDPKLGDVSASESFADARNTARLVADAPRHASAATIDALKQIVEPEPGRKLNPSQMENLRRKTFVEDLLETANEGKKTPLTRQDLLAEKARLDRIIANDPLLRKAVERDQALWRAAGEDLVRRGKLSKDALRQHYVHHEVMDFLTGETTAKLGSPRALRLAARKYLMRRQGSVKDIYTNYLDVRYRSLAKLIRDNMIDDAVKSIADRYAVPKEKATELGYVPFSTENVWDVVGRTSHDKAVMRLVSDVAESMPGDLGRTVREAAEQRLLKGKVFIHPDLAATLSELKDVYQEPGALSKATGLWKQAMLNKNPVRYNFNNLIGDFERGWNAMPEMFRDGGRERFVRVIRDIKDAARGKISPDYRLAIQNSVVDSGEVYHEIGSIKESDLAKGLDPTSKSGWYHPLRAVSSGLRNASTLRENVLRLQAFYTNLDRMRAGKPLAEGVSDIKGMSDPIAAAGKISREALGDYGDFTPREAKLRRGLLPFYSWLKVNTTFWPALFARKGGLTGARSGAARVALKAGSVVARATAVYAASALWNNTVHQEQEEQLPQDVRRKFHVNTGLKDSKGRWITITEPTAFSDFLETAGLQGITTDVAQLLRGQMSAADVRNQIGQRALAPVRKVASRITPAITAPTEAVTSKKFYPDPLNPSPSQQNNPLSRFLSGAGFGEFVPEVSTKPPFINPRETVKTYGRSLLGGGAFGLRQYDPGLSALRNVEDRARRFKERKGYHDDSMAEGPNTDTNRALFYALQDKDYAGAQRLLAKTTPAAFKRYLGARDPLRQMPVKFRAEFAKELGPDGIAEFNRARAFLKQIGATSPAQ